MIAALGGTHAVYGGPGQPFNTLAGLGFAPVDDEARARVEAMYDERGAEIRVEQSSLADPAVAAMVTRRGYARIGYENVLGLALTSEIVSAFAEEVEDAARRGIDVMLTGRDEMPTWIGTTAEGFLTPDAFDGPPPTESFPRESMERIFADFGSAPGCALYLARRDGEIAGGGSLRLVGGLRRRGRHDGTGVEVAGERPAGGVRAALCACDPRPPRPPSVIGGSDLDLCAGAKIKI